MDDARLMRKALALAERGRGGTSPNPMVGALVVSPDGVIVGRGAHRAAGGPHAEVVALDDAGGRARGATLYCTLEPCSHTGRTGPCAPLVARAGIRRAVIAMPDPNPRVDGGGLRHLRENGIETVVGVEAAAAARQNAVFLTNIRHRRTHVTLKAAVSVDGRLGRPGVRTRLTGPVANRRIQRQRAEVDAIAVGAGTILVDDPLLTARGAFRERPLTRVIFDRRLRTPPTARVLSTLEAGPVIIVGSEAAASGGAAADLTAAGARILALNAGDLGTALRALLDAGIASLVLEGGGTLHRAALDAGVVDAVHVYITPRTLGEAGVAWLGEGRIAWDGLRDRRATWLGNDLLVEGVVETDVHGDR
ncbi:MAG TPA: bifunctional diaminohydroxyphosphoribosylaminopyrimidine deaminase/5-amino-6-(5-phosphoribosylamino)uracil reductase RibD [Vicinamibacterales bacterium]|nr:bifunctional diaminohydroxyphosphoribosylaminopyrimidine deaminase/5-amino-6-(5-phosphoribosylamino)uracil reductase RibD [Vicinamibacterales bacterium]